MKVLGIEVEISEFIPAFLLDDSENFNVPL
jgi:hypothetical protein